MKLKFIRESETVDTKIILDNGEEKEFDYLLFINKIIDGEQIDDIIYPDDISDDEKNEIKNMIDSINQIIKANGNEDN